MRDTFILYYQSYEKDLYKHVILLTKILLITFYQQESKNNFLYGIEMKAIVIVHCKFYQSILILKSGCPKIIIMHKFISNVSCKDDKSLYLLKTSLKY